MILKNKEYKIFNLTSQKVLTIIPEDTPSKEVEDRFMVLSKATQCKIDPRIIAWNLKERTILEYYVNLRRPSYEITDVNEFCEEIVTILESIVFTAIPKTISSTDYLESKFQELDFMLKKIQTNYSLVDIKIILNYKSKVLKRLKELLIHQKNILIVFSHGDLWEGNILRGRYKTRIIDWTTFGERSFFFDYYFLLFMIASKNNNFDKLDEEGFKLSQKIDSCDDALLNKLNQNENISNEKVMKHLSSLEFYRNLFYLETIILKLNDIQLKDEKAIGEVLTWIKRFELFQCVYNQKSLPLKEIH